MITHAELLEARTELLGRTVHFFVDQPDVLGVFLAGSLPAGSADPYSDIDLRILAGDEAQRRLVQGRLDWPKTWGELLFNEWLDGTQHCVSHFRPFLKVDVFYWTPAMFTPSPWFRMPAQVFLDRTGLIARVLEESAALTFRPPAAAEVSRVVSKALAGLHEVVRRSRRGEWHYAHTLLDELRSHMARLDGWLRGADPVAPHDLKLAAGLRPALRAGLSQSYVRLDATELDNAAVALGLVLSQQVRELHRQTEWTRSLDNDLTAIDIVTQRLVV
jgi:predicted nucleotidyltransferase